MIEFKTTKPKIVQNFGDTENVDIIFTTSKTQAPALANLKDTELTVIVKKFVKKRSLSQNAYLWVLLDQLAQKVERTKEEIYRFYIKDYGVFQILPIKNDAVESFKDKWGKNGLGWICEDLGESKLNGYTKIVAYFGSSTYNTEEMSRLVDAVVRDCEEQGISTMSVKDILLLDNENDLM